MGYVSLIAGKRGSDILGGVVIFPGISSSADSGSVAKSSVDTDSGDNNGNTDELLLLMILMMGVILGRMFILILVLIIILEQPQYT